MFDRYTMAARRVIFWARYEASAFGAKEIDSVHILLGALREGRDLVAKFLPTADSVDALRDYVAGTLPESGTQILTSVDMPLSKGANEVLATAAAESGRLGDRKVRIVHLLLGLAREPAS